MNSNTNTQQRTLLQAITVTVSAVVMIIGTLMGFGVIGTPVEDSAGGVFAADATLVTPDNPAFSIWSLIYIGLMAYVIWQWKHREDPTAIRVGWLASLSMVLNAVWLLVTQLGWIWASLVVILALAVVLVIIVGRLGENTPATVMERIVVDGSFGVYLGWVSIASFANLAVALIFAGFDLPAPWDEIFAIVVLAIAVCMGIAFVLRLKARWSLTAAMAWALVWLAVGRLNGPLFSTPVAVSAIVAALVIVATQTYVSISHIDQPQESGESAMSALTSAIH